MKNVAYEDLNIEQRRMLDAAAEAMENAYVPYSNFHVGAALLSKDGDVITGANVENSAYGSTICAERSALVRANAMGKRMFKSIAVISRGEDFDTTQPSAPCGACRQMIYEASQLSGIDLEVILSTTQKDRIILATINELLPMAFGPVDLGMDIEKYRK